MFHKSLAALFFALVFFVCAPTQAQDTPQGPIKIVASFSILGDMITQIGGPDVEVVTLVGPDQDAHAFQPAPADVKKLVDAEIIAINGLHFEGWIGRLVKASETKAKLLVASAGIKPRMLTQDDPQHHDAHAHGGQAHAEPALDPHAWQDLRNGQIYVRNIANALIAARPDKREAFTARARALYAALGELDKQARADFAAIPKNKRTIITSHDAFGYFAEAFGLTFLAPVGMGNEVEPSAADVARLIEQIKRERASSVFIENMSDPRLIQQIAKDTGAKIGGKLYADALSKPDGEAPTYLEMMRHNIKALLQGL